MLAGVAAAVCISPQALASPLANHTAAQHATVSDMLAPQGQSTAQLLSASRPATASKPGQPARYTVRPGDSLSAIAGRVYHNQDAWPVIYWANHRQIRWANDIMPGQVLRIPAKPARIPNAPGQLGPAAIAAVSSAQTASPAYVPAQSASTYSGGSGFAACVIARESGGNAQAWNPNGHYGLYQFSASTWAAYGGNPAAFGNASVAQQNQVFNNAIAAGGQSNWSPYDGC